MSIHDISNSTIGRIVINVHYRCLLDANNNPVTHRVFIEIFHDTLRPVSIRSTHQILVIVSFLITGILVYDNECLNNLVVSVVRFCSILFNDRIDAETCDIIYVQSTTLSDKRSKLFDNSFLGLSPENCINEIYFIDFSLFAVFH